nr:DUF3017 domain-containing protein [Williamsia sterculiae]
MTARGLPRPQTPARIRHARRLRALLVQLPFLLVIVLVAIAAVFLMVERWRRGAVILGSAALVASLLRALLPSSRVGLLQVRTRMTDVVMTAAVGITILWLATSIDPLGTK